MTALSGRGTRSGSFGKRLRSLSDFHRLWGAQTVSSLGDEVTLVALPTVAILLLRASPFQIGLLTAAGFAGYPLLGLAGGVWLDRTRRRTVLVAADLTRCAALTSIPLVWQLGRVSLLQLYAVAIAMGIASALFNAAHEAYVPYVVGRDRLDWAYRRFGLTSGTAEVAGPAMGGGLVQLLGAYAALCVDAASFLLSSLGIAAIRTPQPQPQPREASREPLRTALSSGWRFVWRHGLIRPLMVSAMVMNFGRTLKVTLLVVFLYRGLSLRPAEVGLVLALGSIGALIGAPCSGILARVLGTGRVFIVSALGQGLIWLALPLAVLLPAGIGVGLIGSISGFFIPVWNINSISLRQSLLPDEMRGRVAAVVRSTAWASIPVASLAAGGIAGLLVAMWGERTGLIAVMEISGLAWSAAVLPLPLRAFWNLRSMQDIVEHIGQTGKG